MAEIETVRPSRWAAARPGLLAGALLLVLVGGLAAVRWWTADDPPQIAGGGWSSHDMESLVISTPPTVFHHVFRCEPGTLTQSIEVVAPERGSVYLESVELPLLDDVWADMGWATRVGTEAMRTPTADWDDLVHFEGARLDEEPGEWVRMRLSWEIHECTRMDGYLTIDRARLTYRQNGRTRSVEVEVEPILLTTLDLDYVAAQVSVRRVGE